MKNKTVLVTGGTGFVGSHLVESLIDAGARVITTFKSLDPRSYFMTQSLDKKSVLAPLDITEYESLFDLVTKYEVEYIFHLAAQPLVEAAYYNPRRTFDSNIRGTINVLESARLYPHINGVIFASSDKAYGKLKVGKEYVETDPLKGDHPYEVSKSAADLIVTSYYKTYNLPVVITRFGNIYGEGDLNFSRIIPGAMQALVTKTKLQLRSDGSFVRDYLYVKDVARGYLMLAEKIASIKGQSFNFGSKDTLSVFDLLQQVESVLGKTVRRTVLNSAKNEIPYQSLNYSKIKKTIGWKPTYSLETTIQNIYDWYKNIL